MWNGRFCQNTSLARSGYETRLQVPLLALILLVTLTEYHCAGALGKLITSDPLMFCKRRPPPVPLSAALPIIRLALITRPGPAPSLGPTEPRGDTQSWSTVEHGGST